MVTMRIKYTSVSYLESVCAEACHQGVVEGKDCCQVDDSSVRYNEHCNLNHQQFTVTYNCETSNLTAVVPDRLVWQAVFELASPLLLHEELCATIFLSSCSAIRVFFCHIMATTGLSNSCIVHHARHKHHCASETAVQCSVMAACRIIKAAWMR